MIVNRLFKNISERDQLLKCIALTKHEYVFKICFENCLNLICRFAVAN